MASPTWANLPALHLRRGTSAQIEQNPTIDFARDLESLFGLLQPPTVSELLEEQGAIPTLDELLAPFERDPESEQEPFPRVNSAQYESLAREGKLDVALRQAIDDSLSSFEAKGAVSFELASSMFALGNLLESKGRAHEATRAFCSTIPILSDLFGPQHPELAICWIRIGAARMVAGDFEEADQCARTGMGILRVEGGAQSSWLPNGLHNLGIVNRARGDLDQAERLFETSLEYWKTHPGNTEVQKASTSYELSRVLRLKGEFERSAKLSREALDIRSAHLPPGHPAISQSLSGLASLRRDQGLLAEAEALYRDALRRYRSELNPAHPQLAIAASDLALLLADRGELEESEGLLESAAQSFRAMKLDSLLATAINNLAHIYALRKRPNESENHFREAIELYRQLYGARDLRVAIASSSLALLLHEQSDLEEAEPMAREALAVAESVVGTESPLVASMTTALAGILLEKRELPEADRLASRAVQIHTQFSSTTSPQLAAALARLASIRFDQSEFEEASALFEEALEKLEWLRNRVVGAERERALFAGRFELGDLAAQLISARVSAGTFSKAIDVAERRSGRVLLDMVLRRDEEAVERARRISPKQAERLEEYLQEEKIARAHLFEEEAQFRRAPSRDRSVARIEPARLALRQAESSVLSVLAESGPDPRPSTAAELRAGLLADEALVYFIWSEPALTVLTVTRETPSFAGISLAVSREEIRELRAEAVALSGLLSVSPGKRPEGISLAQLHDRMNVLGSRLFPMAIRPQLKRAKHIVIVADGPLNDLPFDVLLADQLKESRSPKSVTYAPSGTVFQRLRSKGQALQSESSGSALVVGDPSFPSTPAQSSNPGAESALDSVRLWGGRLDPLPGTRFEANGVASTLRLHGVETSVLLGEAATLTQLEKDLSGRRILHLATHGLVGSSARPYDASLALSVPAQSTPSDYGFLTLDYMLREWRDKLRDCELVVLSACDTRRGARIGDSFMALPWGFFHAGTPTVIASLWRVDDIAASLLMQRFYENLFGVHGETLSLTDSLEQAKTWLRTATRRDLRGYLSSLDDNGRSREPNGSSSELRATSVAPESLLPYADPYFWAGFVLIGDPN